MIRTETEYQEASARLADERTRLTDHRARLKEAGLGGEEIKRVFGQFKETIGRTLDANRHGYLRGQGPGRSIIRTLWDLGRH